MHVTGYLEEECELGVAVVHMALTTSRHVHQGGDDPARVVGMTRAPIVKTVD